MECKKFGLSDEETDWIKSGEPKGGIAPQSSSEGWFNKVHDDICCARCQLGKAKKSRHDKPHQKFIFISFSFDTPDWIREAPARREAEAHLREWEAILKRGGVQLMAFEGFDVGKPIVSPDD